MMAGDSLQGGSALVSESRHDVFIARKLRARNSTRDINRGTLA